MGDFRIRAGDFLLESDRQAALDALVRSPERFTDEVTEAFGIISNKLEVSVKRNMADYSPGGNSRIQVRTGKLRQSIVGRVQGEKDLTKLAVLLTAGNRSVPYARIQEMGGVVRPRRARNLRIPLPHILTGAGAVKGKYQIYNQGGKWMTGDGKPTWISRSGRAIMVNEGGRPTPIWALKREVKLKPRLGLGSAINDGSDMMRTEVLRAIRRSLQPRREA